MRLSSVLKVSLSWVPFFALWALFMVVYGSAAPGSAIVSSLTAIGGGALLGIGVWWFSGKYPWPDRVRPTFYLAHMVAGTVYAALWLLIELSIGALRMGESLIALISHSSVLGWQLLMGLWLYGLVAGVSYAVRIRRSLQEQQRAAARAEALAVQAQLQTLRAQLNPHFLFNALHSLSALIGDEPERAEEAVERLGDLLRYALDEAGEEQVPLEDEWTFTRHYLELERLRFNSKLRVESRFAPGTLSCLVPSFTLQPLVENALHHAIAARPEGGTIQIGAELYDTSLIITVRDDGPGSEIDGPEGSGGRGLSALQRRLEAMYRGAASLNITTAPGEGFTATVSLPLDPQTAPALPP